MLAAAMNPCPCGYYTDPSKECTCAPPQIQKYMARISGPLLDRIDIHIEVPQLSTKKYLPKRKEKLRRNKRKSYTGKEIQYERFANLKMCLATVIWALRKYGNIVNLIAPVPTY